MIERAVSAGIPFGWVTADEAYGDNGPLRSYLEGRGISYVLAVARAHLLATPAGGRRYDWALVASVRPEISLLIRRNVSRPSELAFYLCHTPDPATPAWPARPTRSAACSPRSAHHPATSSTPATGHDGATTTKNAPAAATTSDNDCKCREPIYLSSASRGFRASSAALRSVGSGN
jgi:DDE superfamily endonuclease